MTGIQIVHGFLQTEFMGTMQAVRIHMVRLFFATLLFELLNRLIMIIRYVEGCSKCLDLT